MADMGDAGRRLAPLLPGHPDTQPQCGHWAADAHAAGPHAAARRRQPAQPPPRQPPPHARAPPSRRWKLLRNPGVMAKLRAEIDGALSSKETIGEADAAGLPYLQAVVKEAMRLHPVAPILLPHRAVEEGVEIGGYAVPEGSTVIFNAWAIMRGPAAWERPDEFVPERFMGTADRAPVDFRGKAFEFIPFGSGRRLCPGLPMAERVVPFILASLLHAFEWRLPDGVPAEELDVSERFTTANVMAVPLKAVPVVVTL